MESVARRGDRRRPPAPQVRPWSACNAALARTSSATRRNDRQLPRCELAGELWRHRAGRRQQPPPLDRRPPLQPIASPCAWAGNGSIVPAPLPGTRDLRRPLATMSIPRTSRFLPSIASARLSPARPRSLPLPHSLQTVRANPSSVARDFVPLMAVKNFNRCHRPFSQGRDDLPISKAPCPAAGHTSPLPDEQGSLAEKHSSAIHKTSRFCVDMKLGLWEI